MKPWTSGPRELLEHAKEHLAKASPFDCRIAFISIDNAVELTIKTYLGLPKRARKSEGPTRRKLQEASNSFPDLLDLLEEHGEEKLEGIALGDIEWYHRLRNTLYHEGNGVTVGQDKADSYYQISVILFKSLFEEELEKENKLEPRSTIGEIVLRSAQIEHNLKILYRKHFPTADDEKIPVRKAIGKLIEKGAFEEQEAKQLIAAMDVRNEAVYSPGKLDSSVVKNAVDVLSDYVLKIANRI